MVSRRIKVWLIIFLLVILSGCKSEEERTRYEITYLDGSSEIVKYGHCSAHSIKRIAAFDVICSRPGDYRAIAISLRELPIGE